MLEDMFSQSGRIPFSNVVWVNLKGIPTGRLLSESRSQLAGSKAKKHKGLSGQSHDPPRQRESSGAVRRLEHVPSRPPQLDIP